MMNVLQKVTLPFFLGIFCISLSAEDNIDGLDYTVTPDMFIPGYSVSLMERGMVLGQITPSKSEVEGSKQKALEEKFQFIIKHNREKSRSLLKSCS